MRVTRGGHEQRDVADPHALQRQHQHWHREERAQHRRDGVRLLVGGVESALREEERLQPPAAVGIWHAVDARREPRRVDPVAVLPQFRRRDVPERHVHARIVAKHLVERPGAWPGRQAARVDAHDVHYQPRIELRTRKRAQLDLPVAREAAEDGGKRAGAIARPHIRGSQRKTLTRRIQVRDGIVEEGQAAPLRAEQRSNETPRVGRRLADDVLPDGRRVLAAGHDHAPIADADAAAERRERSGSLLDVVEQIPLACEPSKGLVVDRRQAAIKEAGRAVPQNGRDHAVILHGLRGPVEQNLPPGGWTERQRHRFPRFGAGGAQHGRNARPTSRGVVLKPVWRAEQQSNGVEHQAAAIVGGQIQCAGERGGGNRQRRGRTDGMLRGGRLRQGFGAQGRCGANEEDDDRNRPREDHGSAHFIA
jgi:hypothetical protein